MNLKQNSNENEPILNDNRSETFENLTRQQAVIQIATQALLNSNLTQLIQETIELVKNLFKVEYGEILQADINKRQLIIKAGVGWSQDYFLQTTRKIGSGSFSEFVLNRMSEPTIITDFKSENRFKKNEEFLLNGIVSGLSIPIPGKEQPYGIISVFSTKPRTFSKTEQNFFQKIADLLALVVDHNKIESSLLTSQKQLAVILEGIGEGVTAQKSDGHIIYANKMAARLLGFSHQEQLLSSQMQDLTSKVQIFDEEGEIITNEKMPFMTVFSNHREVSGIYRIQVKSNGIERWFIITSSPVYDSFNQTQLAINIFQDITRIKNSEYDQKFLAELSALLARAITFNEVLKSVADMAAKYISDWCIVQLSEIDGKEMNLAFAHHDPQKEILIKDLQKKILYDKEKISGIYDRIKTDEGVFYSEINNDDLKELTCDQELFRIINSLGLHSALILPMIARGKTLGVITLVWAESHNTYGEREIEFGKDLAQRAALAIDNVRLYQRELLLNDELENKVHIRTAQLEKINKKLQIEILERKQAEQDLEKSRALFSDLYNLSPDAIFLVNGEGKIVRVNSQGAVIFGYQQNELEMKSIELLLPDSMRTDHIEHRMYFHKTPSRKVMGKGAELYGRRKSGEQFPVDVLLNPVKIGEDRLVISVVRDITEQKRTQVELEEVQHRLLDSQESERLMLAQELHDGTIQELFSINFQLAEIKNDVASTGDLETLKKINEASEMTQNVIQGLRNISRDLRPPALAPFGLEQALYSHLERFQELHPDLDIHTELEADGQRLEKNLRLILFRIYQNAVSNVARHAQAQKLWVRFKFEERKITLEIQDDGKGFDVPERWVEFVREGHLGLVGIRERVEAINGKLTIDSEPGKGTLIRVDVPLDHN